jgi:hypothetical protein
MPVKVAVLVHRRNYQEPAIRSQDAYHPDPPSPPWLSGEHCCSGLSPDPGTPSAQRLAPSNLTRRESMQSSTARHQAQRPAHHCTSRGLLTLSEEDPRRASHRDTAQEASGSPASQDASHLASTEIHEEGLRPELKAPKTTPPWRVRRQRRRRHPIWHAKSKVFTRNLRP